MKNDLKELYLHEGLEILNCRENKLQNIDIPETLSTCEIG